MKLRDNNLKKDVTKKDKDIYSTLELALEMVLRGYSFTNIDLMRSTSKRIYCRSYKYETFDSSVY